MREYGIITPGFWVGNTGRLLRSDTQTQLLALYLMTSPHANMIGLYYCPIAYIVADTGIPFEGALKGLQRLSEVGFITLDSPSDWIWIREMARYQLAERLHPKDNQIKGIIKELDKIPNIGIKRDFIEKYREAFCLESWFPTSPSEGASKPLRSQDQDQEQDQEEEKRKKREDERAPAARLPSKGARIPVDFVVPPDWLNWAKNTKADVDVDVEAAKFVDYWKSKPGKDGCKLDWEATWRNWIRNAKTTHSSQKIKTDILSTHCARRIA